MTTLAINNALIPPANIDETLYDFKYWTENWLSRPIILEQWDKKDDGVDVIEDLFDSRLSDSFIIDAHIGYWLDWNDEDNVARLYEALILEPLLESVIRHLNEYHINSSWINKLLRRVRDVKNSIHIE